MVFAYPHDNFGANADPRNHGAYLPSKINTMSVKYPEPFPEVRVQHVAEVPPGITLCAAYAGGKWRSKDLADHLFQWVPFVALNQEHQLSFGGSNFVELLQIASAHIYNGDNVILSAPTSFGKTILVDAFIKMRLPHTVLIIIPTIALIDETRRRLSYNFGDQYRIITNPTDSYSPDLPTIFVLTQERYLSRKDIDNIDLLFVDEFYKLDPERDDTRFETLNIALYRALPRAKQHFMAGPHVKSIQLGTDWAGNFRFVQTDYRTVTVNIIDRSSADDKLSTFLSDLRSVGDESSLVFCGTPGSAHLLLKDLVEAGIGYTSPGGGMFSDWISTNYHADWPISKGIDRGIAVHHGRIPRSLGQLFVRFFDEGIIKVLICTSTLIEGVNTSAANVFIYDKKINRTDFDFFSFANIRGRVGRMMRHFVGNAFLYHEPPEHVETDVDVPVLSAPEGASDYIVMNVEPEYLSDGGKKRQDELIQASGLSRDLLAEHTGMGVDLLVEVAADVRQMLARSRDTLVWSQYPDRDQRRAVATIALKVAHRRRDQTGIHTPNQVAWAWSQLESVRTFAGFLRWFSRTFFADDVPAGIDAAFQFLQACEFSFPRTLAAIEALVAQYEPGAPVNYQFYISSMESWFRPTWMKQLDEAGIPLPLGERLAPVLSGSESGREALLRLSGIDLQSIPELSPMDVVILASALRP